MSAAELKGLVPMASVSDIKRSISFYESLGFEVDNTFEHDGELKWAYLKKGGADLMLTHAGGPLALQKQPVIFYLYVGDVVSYRDQLLGKGIAASQLEYPFYAQKGEFWVEDPDGYKLLIG